MVVTKEISTDNLILHVKKRGGGGEGIRRYMIVSVKILEYLNERCKTIHQIQENFSRHKVNKVELQFDFLKIGHSIISQSKLTTTKASLVTISFQHNFQGANRELLKIRITGDRKFFFFMGNYRT